MWAVYQKKRHPKGVFSSFNLKNIFLFQEDLLSHYPKPLIQRPFDHGAQKVSSILTCK